MDRRDLVAELHAESSRAGIEVVHVDECGATRFEFELEAESPESACDLVTNVFRSVYGLNWWADVTALCGAPSMPQAAWN